MRKVSTLCLALGVVAGIGCSRAAKSTEEQAAPKDSAPPAALPDSASIQSPRSAPHIDALIPDSARVVRNSVVEIVIRGSGFEPGSPGRNTVALGPITLNQVPADQTGSEIRFVIPDRYATNNEAPPRPLGPGTYAVTVETVNGKSNSVSIRILP